MSPLWQFHKGRHLAPFKSIDPPFFAANHPRTGIVILMPFYQEYNWILHTVPDKKCTLPQRYRKYFLEIHYDE